VVVALLVPGSRSLVPGNLLILGITGVLLSGKPELIKKSFVTLFTVVIAVVRALSMFDFVNEGLRGFEGSFTGTFDTLDIHRDVPLFGYGTGMGTRVGAKLLTGKAYFIIAENEWTRIIMESGVALCIPDMILHICIAAFLWKISKEALAKENTLLLLLLGVCAIDVLIGKFGQTAAIGFTTAKAGLCLSDCNYTVGHDHEGKNK
jgi:O-antigen ligase